MGSPLFSFVTAFTILTLLVAVSCQTDSVRPPDSSTASQLRVSTPFVAQTSSFAFEVAQQVVAKEGVDKNVLISPLSLHMALGMLLNGANGTTASEIQKTLRLDAQTITEANQTYQNLIENLPRVDAKTTLSLANSVWYRNTFSVESSFQSLIKQHFKAEVSAQNFDDPATVATINNWASQKTNGKIPKIIDQIQPDNVMFLLNALYFKGDWKTQFKAEQTRDTPFKLASGATTTVQMMRLKTALNHGYRATYTAFELPYGSDKFAMTVLLPNENTTADALLNDYSDEEWNQLRKAMTVSEFDIGLPKFGLAYQITLNGVLSAMGMPTAFSDQADFTKINTKGGLTLSFVKQNTFIAVDEKGTEAAAVTSTGVSATAVVLPTLCDRPFVFIIHEKTTGTILFVGKIADPTKTSV